MKKVFDLKILMMEDPNKNNIQSELNKIYQSVEKLLIFLHTSHTDIDRR
jgi:hypothetical protein